MIIILIGTSSSGKSSIGKKLQEYGFIYLSLDEVNKEIMNNKNINIYYDDLVKKQIHRRIIIKRTRDAYNENKNVVIDEMCYEEYLKKMSVKYNIKKFLVYADLNRLKQNFYLRKTNDPRTITTIISHYSKFYTKATEEDPIIDRINKKMLIDLAKENKAAFKNYNDLKQFCDSIAEKMELNGNSDITCRFDYDYAIINDGLNTIDDMVNQIIALL